MSHDIEPTGKWWAIITVTLTLTRMNKSFAAVNNRHNSIENNYCGGKLGFVVSRLGLVGSVRLGLGLVTSLGLGLRVKVSVSISDSGDKPGLPLQ